MIDAEKSGAHLTARIGTPAPSRFALDHIATPALAGKTYLVTGSTDGIGRHTAERLCHAGAHVLVHGRSPDSVADTVASLAPAAGTAAGFVADLADLAQVRRLVAEVTAALGPAAAAGGPPPLTALINNAGVYEPSRATSADGLEMTWAVNVAAPFLLTSLLLDFVAARVVTVASVSAASSIDFGNLQQERGYSWSRRGRRGRCEGGRSPTALLRRPPPQCSPYFFTFMCTQHRLRLTYIY